MTLWRHGRFQTGSDGFHSLILGISLLLQPRNPVTVIPCFSPLLRVFPTSVSLPHDRYSLGWTFPRIYSQRGN